MRIPTEYHPQNVSTPELLRMHKQLHTEAGEAGTGCYIELERALCTEMQKRGFHPRYTDDLACAAKTLPAADTPQVTADEVFAYVGSGTIGIEPRAVTIGQSISANKLYLGVSSPVLRTVSDSILKAVQRQMPPGVQIELDERMRDSDGYVKAHTLYALQLVPAKQRASIITTAKAYASNFQDAAAAASCVFKSGVNPRVPFRVMKQDTAEQIVTGVVLEPERPDGTRTSDSDADIYSAEEIYKGMVFWMENAGTPFSYHHVDQGGKPLSPEDVVILENWQARAVFSLGGQEIPEGSWLLSTRVRHPGLWADIESGVINSWSLGLHAMAGFFEEAESVEP